MSSFLLVAALGGLMMFLNLALVLAPNSLPDSLTLDNTAHKIQPDLQQAGFQHNLLQNNLLSMEHLTQEALLTQDPQEIERIASQLDHYHEETLRLMKRDRSANNQEVRRLFNDLKSDRDEFIAWLQTGDRENAIRVFKKAHLPHVIALQEVLKEKVQATEAPNYSPWMTLVVFISVLIGASLLISKNLTKYLETSLTNSNLPREEVDFESDAELYADLENHPGEAGLEMNANTLENELDILTAALDEINDCGDYSKHLSAENLNLTREKSKSLVDSLNRLLERIYSGLQDVSALLTRIEDGNFSADSESKTSIPTQIRQHSESGSIDEIIGKTAAMIENLARLEKAAQSAEKSMAEMSGLEKHLNQLSDSLNENVRNDFKNGLPEALVNLPKQDPLYSPLHSPLYSIIQNIHRLFGELAHARDGFEQIEAALKTAELGEPLTLSGISIFGSHVGRISDVMKQLQATLWEMSTVATHLTGGHTGIKIESKVTGDLRPLKDNLNALAETLEKILSAFNEVSTELAQGRFYTNPNIELKDAWQDSLEDLNNAVGMLREFTGGLSRSLNSVASGNLCIQFYEQAPGNLLLLQDNVNMLADNLNNSLGGIEKSTRFVSIAASQTGEAINQVARSSEQQVMAIQNIASAIDETSLGIQQVAENSQTASVNAREAVQIMNAGRQKMDSMINVVNTISKNSKEINAITGMIDKIATQTNLLSLNASIEAARAGQHGRGFAVVAEEVKKLADHSMESVQEINRLVGQAMKDAKSAVETATAVNTEMERVSDTLLKSDVMMQEIAAAVEQQGARITDIKDNVNTLNNISQENAAASQQITATVENLETSTKETAEYLSGFKFQGAPPSHTETSRSQPKPNLVALNGNPNIKAYK